MGVKEVYTVCKDIGNPLHMCFSGVDNTELTPLCGTSHCANSSTSAAPMMVPLNLPTQEVNNLPAELSFPATGQLEAPINFFLPLRPSGPEFVLDDPGFSYTGSVIDVPAAVKGTFHIPNFSIEVPSTNLPNPSECIEEEVYSTKKIKNKRLRVAANQIVQVRANTSEESTLPPSLVAIPNGQISRMKTRFNRTIPIRDIQLFVIEICNTAIQGYIEISLAFRPTSINDPRTAWDFTGVLLVSASPTDGTDYLGTIDGGLVMFSSDEDGELVDVEDIIPEAIAPTFSYQAESTPNDNILGWMEIDFSSLPNQQWQPFKMNWVLDGKPLTTGFPNAYALGLGQLVQNSPGSTPKSIKLPVIEQGSDPMILTIGIPGTADQLTIKYALFGSADIGN